MSYNPSKDIATSPYQEQFVSEKTQLINILPMHGVTVLRDITSVSGSANITNNLSELHVFTGASAFSSASLETRKKASYYAGYLLDCSIGARATGTLSAGQTRLWGYFDTDNGIGFGEDSTGIYTFRKRNSVEESKTYVSDWSTSYSSDPALIKNLLTSGTIWGTEFSWYGYGSIAWYAWVTDDQNNKSRVYLHREVAVTGTILNDPGLPVRVEVANGSSAADCGIFVGGRSVHIYGDGERASRYVQCKSSGTYDQNGFTSILAIRKKTPFPVDSPTNIQAVVNEAKIFTSVASEFKLLLASGSISGSWINPNDDTLSSETSIEITDIERGLIVDPAEAGIYYLLDAGFSAGDQVARNNQPVQLSSEKQDFSITINDDDIVIFQIKSIGATSQQAEIIISVEEMW